MGRGCSGIPARTEGRATPPGAAPRCEGRPGAERGGPARPGPSRGGAERGWEAAGARGSGLGARGAAMGKLLAVAVLGMAAALAAERLLAFR